MTRRHDHAIVVDATPEAAFRALVTPSALRAWWSVARAIVVPETGGAWALAWGDDEDEPEYVGTARIAAIEPPRRLRLDRWGYFAKTGPLPFGTGGLTVEFTVEPAGNGARVRVVHDGIPDDAIADAYHDGCEQGWRDTLANLNRYLESS